MTRLWRAPSKWVSTPGPPLACPCGVYTIGFSVNMALKHKHLKIDQAKLDRARRLLGAGTEQETVDHALDILVAEETVLRALRKVKGVGGFIDRFAS